MKKNPIVTAIKKLIKAFTFRCKKKQEEIIESIADEIDSVIPPTDQHDRSIEW